MKKRITSLFALRTIRLRASSVLAATFLLVLPVVIQAQQVDNPRVISYQGSVTTNSGSQVTGDHQITTTLYSDANGTQAVWSGTYKQQITGGLFTVLLGSGAYPLPPAQDFSKTLWVGVKIDGGEELKPLTQLTGAPYSVSIADKSVTKDKIAVDYVGSIAVNGKRITGKGTTLNLVDGLNTSLRYDEGTNSLSLNSIEGIGIPTTQNLCTSWMTCGNALFPVPPINQTFGSTDANDVIMVANATEQMRMLGQQVIVPGSTGTFGILLPASIANGTGVIFQGSGANPSTYIHTFGGASNFFAGDNAGNLTMTGTENTGVGNVALNANTTGAQNIAIGRFALFKNTGGSDNAASGYGALESNLTGNNNTANGTDALFTNTTGGENTASGFKSLFNSNADYNTGYGSRSLFGNTTGSNNTGCGVYVLFTNSIGLDNTGTGAFALYYTTGSGNTANGYDALYKNSTGYENTAIGDAALYLNTTGHWNTASGGSALNSNTTGSYNTADGYAALGSNTTGANNTAIGTAAGQIYAAGSNNTFVGYFADASANSLTNATAIGANAIVGQSNAVILGSGADVGIRTSTPRAELEVSGTGAIIVPVGTTAQRPIAVQGMIRYNTTTGKFEGYDGAAWQNLN